MVHPKIDFEIHAFTSDNYTQIAAVHNLVYPEFSLTAAELARDEKERDSQCLCERWTAISDSRVVAHAGFCQYPETYRTGEFTLIGGVIPEYRGHGIGTALFDVVITRLHELGASLMRSYSRADRQDSIRFLRNRGFVEFMRERDWELDVTGFDETPYLPLIQQLSCEGIRILSLTQLEHDPDRDSKLYALERELLKDTPGGDMHRELPFERWLDLSLYKPEVTHDGYFVAVDGDSYIGKTHFETSETDESLLTKLTGVVRSHRRRGVALAMKVKAIAWARRRGYPRILTDNHSNNESIQKLNQRLGFHKLPEWIYFEKRLAPGGDGRQTQQTRL